MGQPSPTAVTVSVKDASCRRIKSTDPTDLSVRELDPASNRKSTTKSRLCKLSDFNAVIIKSKVSILTKGIDDFKSFHLNKISFCSEPVMDDDDVDEKGTNGGSHGNDSHGFKKKRRSVNEKFLEDNSEYYGFQVLTSKLRSSGEAPCCSSSSSSASNSFQNSSSVWEFLHDDKVGKSVTQAFAPSPTPSDCRRTFNSVIVYVLLSIA